MADLSIDDLRQTDRNKVAALALEAGCGRADILAAIVTSYLHLLDTADFVLPKNGPGVRAKRLGVRLG